MANERKIKIEDLPRPEVELNSEEAEKLTGGSFTAGTSIRQTAPNETLVISTGCETSGGTILNPKHDDDHDADWTK